MSGLVKVGVIGVGSEGQHHARIFSQMSSCELAGIYDESTERSLEVARLFKTRAFTSLDELIGMIDAASVVLPPAQDTEILKKLAAKKVHMLIDTPIAGTAEEAEKLIAETRKKKLVIQVCHVERFTPVMNLIESRITKPRFLEATNLRSYPPPRTGSVPEGTEVSVVFDQMLHDLEIVLRIMNCGVKQIQAVGMPVLSRSEDIGNVRMLFENGCIANLTASRISQERARKIRVFQEDAYVDLDYLNSKGQVARILGGRVSPEPVPIERSEPLVAELQSFVNCIATRKGSSPASAHAADALQLAYDICQSMRNSPS